MHEHGFCVPLVDAIVARAEGRQVEHVRVRVGARHRIVDEAFDAAFAHAAEETVAAGAVVELVVTDATATCTACGTATSTNDPLDACSRCGEFALRLQGGDDFAIEAVRFSTVGG